VAKGASLFERHIGVETKDIKLNAYSSTPEQLEKWFEAFKLAKEACGESNGRNTATTEEVTALNKLRRGVYLNRDLRKGEVLARSDVYFGIPYLDGQLSSGEWRPGITIEQDLPKDAPLYTKQVKIARNPERSILTKAIHEAKAMLRMAGIPLSNQFKTEFSHHYGIAKFREVGAIIIDVFNRSYCKKLIIQLPGQTHPLHFHKLKEETFQVLYGQVEVEVDGQTMLLRPGQTVLIQPGVWHRFWSTTGVVFEEISTTHFNSDSYYRDKIINKKAREERKTVVDHWGRFQLLGEEEAMLTKYSLLDEEEESGEMAAAEQGSSSLN
jgi:mannose-6-phosphate isomerase-like protein (cupin superfamily)